MNMVAHSGFETQRCHQKSKTGVSVTPQKGLMSKIFLKKIANIGNTRILARDDSNFDNNTMLINDINRVVSINSS